MSGITSWLRIAGCTGWALVVLAAFRSEPFFYRLIGDQYEVSHHWCGLWGCSASIPRLLAWQLPVILTLVPAAWVAVNYVPWITRNAGRIGAVVLTAAVVWIAVHTVESWSENELRNIADVVRRIVFTCVAGTSVVIPVSLAGFVFVWKRQRLRSGADADAGSGPQQAEDLGDVVVTHVDAST